MLYNFSLCKAFCPLTLTPDLPRLPIKSAYGILRRVSLPPILSNREVYSEVNLCFFTTYGILLVKD